MLFVDIWLVQAALVPGSWNNAAPAQPSLSGNDEYKCECWNQTPQSWWLHPAGTLMNTHEAGKTRSGLRLSSENSSGSTCSQEGICCWNDPLGNPMRSPFSHTHTHQSAARTVNISAKVEEKRFCGCVNTDSGSSNSQGGHTVESQV